MREPTTPSPKSRPLTKYELARQLSERTGASLTVSLRTVQQFFEAMAECLANRRNITIREFGTLKLRRKKPRQCYDMTRGVQMMTHDRWRVMFIPSNELNERLLVKPDAPIEE